MISDFMVVYILSGFLCAVFPFVMLGGDIFKMTHFPWRYFCIKLRWFIWDVLIVSDLRIKEIAEI